MPDREVVAEFPLASGREGGQKAVELKTLIEEIALSQGISEALDIRIERINKETQDFGATLILGLGTPAALAIAKGIHDFIAKYGDHVDVKTNNGTVVARGSAAKNIDVAATVAALKGL